MNNKITMLPVEIITFQEFSELVCELLDIDMPEFVIKDVWHSQVYAWAHSATNQVVINKKLLSSNKLFIAKTLVHELRHMWQFANVLDQVKGNDNSSIQIREDDAYQFENDFVMKIIKAYDGTYDKDVLSKEIPNYCLNKQGELERRTREDVELANKLFKLQI